MFTGLIEEMGSVLSMGSNSLEISCSTIQDDLSVGDSVAVNGVCLTVVSFSSRWFKAEVMPVTLKTTNLGDLKRGSMVNLERAMELGTRIGGHLVAGHVDGTSTIVSKKIEGDALLVTIAIPAGLDSLIINKGSIAVDGTSLTVAALDEGEFTVSLVGHTKAHTTLADKSVGGRVNIECDQMGKYVQRILGFVDVQKDGKRNSLSMEFLAEHGFG